jgi:hypothetical protein
MKQFKPMLASPADMKSYAFRFGSARSWMVSVL